MNASGWMAGGTNYLLFVLMIFLDEYGNSSQVHSFECSQTDETFFTEVKDPNQLFIIGCNIQSLNAKLNKLTEFLDNLSNNFKLPDIIALQETHLNPVNPSPHIKGYNNIFHSRVDAKGGGIGLLINQNLSFTKNDRLSIFIERVFESIASDIYFGCKRVTVVSIYKPPNSPRLTNKELLDSFLLNLHNLLSNAPENTFIILDSNINIAASSSDSNQYINTFESSGFTNIINIPSRITLNSATSIDQILTNSTLTNGKCGTINTDLSDHLPTYVICKPNTQNLKKNETKLKRQFTDHNMSIFEGLLVNVNWNNVLNQSETTSALNSFDEIWSVAFEQCFPLKNVKINRSRQKINEFFTTGLLTSRSKKITLYRNFLKNRTAENKRTYLAYRNCYNKTVRAAKKLHFNSKIDLNCNPKNAWEFLNQAIGKNFKSSSNISDIRVRDKIITDPIEIANNFNDFFSSIAEDIVSEIPFTRAKPLDYITEYPDLNFAFKPVNRTKVGEIINELESKSSLDINGYSTILIKKVSSSILTPLTHIINLSLSTGVFPDSLKISRVCPIFKQGDHKEMNNYRPISCLSAFSKIFEKIVHEQLFQYLDANKILNQNQFGFQKGRSTVHALTKIMNFLADSFNNNKFVVAVFLDYKKAFDLVSHDILLKKLEKIGIRGINLNWFKTYLANRKMYTMINGSLSRTMKVINRSVPQGSILGPLLFLIFINDMPNCTNLLSILFADDTTTLACGDDIELLGPIVNTELQKIGTWLKANELSINTSKTKIMIFSQNRKIPDFNFVFNNNDVLGRQDPNLISSIERIQLTSNTKTFKMLGVHFDEKLSFDFHCQKVINKISSALFMINRAKHMLSKSSLKRLYFAMIHPHLLYCLPIYSNTSPKNIDKIFKKQKQSIRIINNAKFNAHTEPLFYNSSILPFNELIIEQKLVLLHPIMHNYSKNNLEFQKLSNVQVHNYPLRNCHDFHVPRTLSTRLCKMPFFDLPKVWNSIDDEIKKISLKKTFKSQIKNLAMDKYANFRCNNLICYPCLTNNLN